PVELVIAAEAPDLPRGPVAKDETMVAGRNRPVRVADLDPHAIGETRNARGDRHSVEGCALEGEADAHRATVGAPVAGRKIAEDAVVDRDILDLDVDRLGDLERAVLLDLDVTEEAADALVGVHRSGDEQQQRGKDAERAEHAQAAGWANETLGAV